MWWERYSSSGPKKVAGGIKAQSKRGDFGVNWWAKKWVKVIEGFHIDGRLQRGRSYARGGQVLSIDVEPGKVSAKVQGSMSKPYAVTIEVKKLKEGEWDKVAEALSSQAVYAAKLLAGEFPPEVETFFERNKLSLFPSHANDLKTSCSCPDYSNPCKHIAAVYYLLAETFDRDPFLLFRLRGRDREALFAKLNASGPSHAPDVSEQETSDEPVAPIDPATFWQLGALPPNLYGDLTRPPVAAGLLQPLGPIPFWRGREPLLDAMQGIYLNAGEQALRLVAAEAETSEAVRLR
jgi:uncharacterized Zn finger protein